MARTKVPITVIDLAGNSVAGASVTIQNRSTGANAVLYTTETGATTVNNPATTDSQGRVQAWVDRGSYNANITASGISPYTEPFESAPQADIGKFALYTALPTGLGAADNGTVIRFLADQTNGVEWWLAYRYYQADGTTVNPSSYKWEFIGGPHLVSDSPSFSADLTTLSSWVAAASISAGTATLTVPLAGDYDVDFGHASFHTANSGLVYGNVAVSGIIPSPDLQSAAMAQVATGGQEQYSVMRSRRYTAIPINSILDLRFYTAVITARLRAPWLKVKPVRVG